MNQQAEKIKELAEQYSDAFADSKATPWSGRLTALTQTIQGELHTAIDEVCSELEWMRGLGELSDRDAFEAWYQKEIWPYSIFERLEDGRYNSEPLQDFWKSWQAAEEHKRAVIEKLRGEVAALAKDAERYRWVREKSAYVGVNQHHKTCLWTLSGIFEIDGQGFDAAIDKAKQESALQALADEGLDRGEWEVAK